MSTIAIRRHETPRLFAAIREALSVLGAAIRASAAVENHHQPAKSDLQILGIKPGAISLG